MGDTAWELFHRLNKEEIRYYLQNRKAKGFTVIKAVLLSECDGLTVPTPEGFLPLDALDPTRPNKEYFEKVDFVVDAAANLGLYLAILPTWGAHTVKENGYFENHPIFDTLNARIYGEYLGKRYADKWNLVWVLGGDRPGNQAYPIWQAMAEGLRKGDKGKHLITYHPRGYQTSSQWFHTADWLDFNMVQSGHGTTEIPNWELIQADYKLQPVKPVLDGEPNYEGLGIGFHAEFNGVFSDYEVRRAAYWSLFSGAFGHTYGNNAIWQMYKPTNHKPALSPRTTWNLALEDPGGKQMRYVKNLMLSRPYLTRIPDQTVLITDPETAIIRYKATRDGTLGKKDATYIMAYWPVLRPTPLQTSYIAAEELHIWWYDPRLGLAYDLGTRKNTGVLDLGWNGGLSPEMGGPDWILVVDDASKNYPAPGQEIYKP